MFDRHVKRMQRNRTVRNGKELSRVTDYIKDEVAGNLVDRLLVRHLLLDEHWMEGADSRCWHPTGHKETVSCDSRLWIGRRAHRQASRSGSHAEGHHVRFSG